MLTRLQAFAAMQYFLDQYYWKTLTDDIVTLLLDHLLAHEKKIQVIMKMKIQ